MFNLPVYFPDYTHIATSFVVDGLNYTRTLMIFQSCISPLTIKIKVDSPPHFAISYI